MATFNANFWEVQTSSYYIESVPSERALWYESEIDRERRYAMSDFCSSVLPHVKEMVDSKLTPRQQEIVRMYYFQGKTQEEIAAALALTQSTISRHLFGTVRGGRRVGGAIPKLRKVLERSNPAQVIQALDTLQERFAKAC